MSRPSIQRLAQLRGASSARRASTRLAGPRYQTLSASNPTTRQEIRQTAGPSTFTGLQQAKKLFHSTAQRRNEAAEDEEDAGSYSEADHEHAVISTFDLFSIGIGPSSSHTVGPMRAGNIFVADLVEANLLHKVNKIRVSIYGSLALTGEGHMTPSALLLGLESADVETVDTAYVPERFTEIKATKKLFLGQGLSDGKGKEVDFDYERDFVWEWGRKLPMHSNGMRFTVFDDEGYVLATNDMFSVGGGFVVNGALSINPDASLSSSSSSSMTQVESADGTAETAGRHPADLAENMFYKEIRRSDAAGDRRTGAEVKPLDEAKEDSMLLEGAQTGLSPVVSTAENGVDGGAEHGSESSTSESSGPRYPFRDATSLLALCRKHNLTIAQLVYENEKSHGYTDEEIYHKLFKIWQVMDTSILESVQAPLDTKLPGSLKLHRRAPALYRRLTRGLYSTAGHTSPNPLDKGAGEKASLPGSPAGSASASAPATIGKSKPPGLSVGRRPPPRILGSLDHPITPSPSRRTTFPTMDYLTVYAIAVNETNAAGGRIVTAPTNGAAGIIPAVLKYTIEFISDDPERDIPTFLLTAAAIGMLYKRGATISAAEGGCMAEVGVACSMAAGAFAACMGASPEAIEQAAEIGIEHNLGLTCDPIGGLVQAPCIERNALGAIKAISSANLALSSETGTQKVRLDDAIRAMRLTAKGMRNEFKETSLSGLATSVPFNIPVSVPDC
ncbi:L-serine ammonia-lyase [Colletotrichum orchidophilum]|uniref:L-serine ammonia-lyase n=1 Tax=Colletotrichum orchidophilum TaxID=1209926 RepID=A0A1G4BL48_9PEZI|nr:L-serine ammonia-lyase [Colletotrichum orchidophilum]OHF02134.1 L-serine ammonia-lyase [Colletotrichum orchidophilum]